MARLDRRGWLGLAIAAGLGLGATVALQRMPAPPRSMGMTQVLRTVLDDPGSPNVGPASAKVTIVVFTDYACSVCRADRPGLERIRRERPDLRFIFKDWPILGPASTAAARVALAADRQGRYLAVHNALMEAPARLNDDALRRTAIAAGADWTRLATDLQDPAIAAQLNRHASQAWSLGLQGTPAYVVGADLYLGAMNESRLRAAIRRAEKAAG